jgi:hypothetical protein
MTTRDVEVHLDDEATQAEVEAVERAFRKAGYDTQPEASVGRKSLELLPWVIYVTVGGTILSFFQGFGSEAGKDAWHAVKRWAREIWDAREGAGNGSGSIVLRDSEHSNVVLSNNIPDAALDALRDLDWSEHRGGYLVWNDERGEWVDPLKRLRDS